MADSALDTFTAAYITTALWSSNDESRPDGGDPLDSNYDESDLAAETQADMKRDCAAFLSTPCRLFTGGTIRAGIESAIGTGKVCCGPDFDEWGHAGHDFWLTRQGHGAGFWDGDWPCPHDEALTAACRAFPETWLYVGDDGQVWQS